LENKKDLCEVPEEVKEDMQFIFMETIEELIQETLGIKLPRVSEFHFYIPDKNLMKKDEGMVKV
jgi:ATP-dependent Lon protease